MNTYEKEVSDKLTAKGWTVLHRGWPDLMCVNWTQEEIDEFAKRQGRKGWNPQGGGSTLLYKKPLQAFCVELKRGADRVFTEQTRMHLVLNAAGIPCRVAKEADLESLMRRKGTQFTAPETRQRLMKDLQDSKTELQRQLVNLENLESKIKASTVLFDGEDPDMSFVNAEDEGLAAGTFTKAGYQ